LIDFQTNNQKAERALRDIENLPHMFVLGCVMDRQIKAERAWELPYLFSEQIGGTKFNAFKKISRHDTRKLFKKNSLHRFPEKMADIFYDAVQDIQNKYQGDASKIWNDNPPSALIIRRFLEFKGVGVKIATMATNILVRDYKIKMKDYSSIDISPDIQVKKALINNGFLREDVSNEEIIYWAREVYPEYPGILDLRLWEMGRDL